MLIHCSKKLAAKLPSVSPGPVPDNSPLGAWHGHLFTIDRRQCVVFCHDATRFVLFMHGMTKKEFANIDCWFLDLFANTMLKLGYPQETLEKGVALLGNPRFDAVTDRSVQGTINQLRFEIECFAMDVANVMDLPPYSLSARLCHRPTWVKGMKKSDCLWPDTAMRDLIEKTAPGPYLSVVQ